MWMIKGVDCRPAYICMLLFLGACRQDMGQQPKYRPLEASTFFADGRSARQPVPERSRATFRATTKHPVAFKTGNNYVETVPYPITLELLTRGQQRFNINCSPCHSQTGDGNGMIVRREASFHRRHCTLPTCAVSPLVFYFDVITNGLWSDGRLRRTSQTVGSLGHRGLCTGAATQSTRHDR